MHTYAWDEQKSDANREIRGFDFGFASRIFDGWTLEYEDRRHDYGEVRVQAIGAVDGVHLTVIYTDRFVGQRRVRRIISARRSSRREQIAYGNCLQDTK